MVYNIRMDRNALHHAAPLFAGGWLTHAARAQTPGTPEWTLAGVVSFALVTIFLVAVVGAVGFFFGWRLRARYPETQTPDPEASPEMNEVGKRAAEEVSDEMEL